MKRGDLGQVLDEAVCNLNIELHVVEIKTVKKCAMDMEDTETLHTANVDAQALE